MIYGVCSQANYFKEIVWTDLDILCGYPTIYIFPFQLQTMKYYHHAITKSSKANTNTISLKCLDLAGDVVGNKASVSPETSQALL